MKVSISNEQRHFFERKGFLELEGLFSQEEVKSLLDSIQHEMKARKKGASSTDPFILGRNLAQSSEKIQEFLFSFRFSALAYELIMKRPLRYAFDQLYRPSNDSLSFKEEDSLTLDEVSSVQGLALAAVLGLEDPPSTDEALPSRAGNAVFFYPNKPWPPGLRSGNFLRLLFVFAGKSPRYLLQPLDYHTHTLKSLGYVFGDSLKETTHPVLFR
jgi:hypothetical protein